MRTTLRRSLATLALLSASLVPALALSATPAAAAGPDRLAFHPVRDRVIQGPVPDVIQGPPGGVRRAGISIASGYYSVGDGNSVYIQRDSAYTNADAQQVANVLGGLLHGGEIRTVSIRLATSQNLSNICGADALSCYYPDADEIVTSGSEYPGSGGQPSRDFVLAHEYGHHVAGSSNGYPWSAIDWGTKRWADAEHVCPGVRAGRLFPGDEGSHYWDDPGEAFAESFAFLNYPSEAVSWDYNALLQPNQTAFSAISADVNNPWAGNHSTTWSGALSLSRAATGRTVSTPLDGRLKVTLNGPGSADYDLSILAPGTHQVLARAATNSANETLRYNVCGINSVRVRVVRYRGSGPFSVRISRP